MFTSTAQEQHNKFAFLIHFRYAIKDDLKLYWKPLHGVPEKLYRHLFERVEFPSVKWGSVNCPEGKELGRNEIIPLNAEMLLNMGPKQIKARINKSIDRLVEKGYNTVGLGALTSPLTSGGISLRDRKDICLTNGNAYTAVSLFEATLKLIEINEQLAESVAIVGASGSVGSCLAKQLAKHGGISKLLLVARNPKRLERLQKELKQLAPQLNIEVHTSIDAIRQAKLITLLTTSTENLVQPEYLMRDAVILDGTQPRNTSPELVAQRPDVTVIDGGIIEIPKLKLKNGGFGLPDHNFFACFSETALLSIDGHKDHFSLGNPTLEQAEYIRQLAKKHAAYGFGLAPFLSYGKPLKNSMYGLN